MLLIGVFALSFLFTSPVWSQNPGWTGSSLDDDISKVRKGMIHLTGKPGETVQIKQVEHEFWFGCALASGVFSPNTRMSEEDIRLYKEKFLENFNSAVTETNGLPCRGHNLFWGIEKFIQPWVKDLDKDELGEALEIRGRETARHFKGRFAEYDLNNEMINGNYVISTSKGAMDVSLSRDEGFVKVEMK